MRAGRMTGLALALAGALALGGASEGADPPGADGPPEVPLGPISFSIPDAARVFYVVVDVAVVAPGGLEGPGALVRLRDAALGAVRDTPPAEIAGGLESAALEGRILRAMRRRGLAAAAVRVEVIGTHEAPRR